MCRQSPEKEATKTIRKKEKRVRKREWVCRIHLQNTCVSNALQSTSLPAPHSLCRSRRLVIPREIWEREYWVALFYSICREQTQKQKARWWWPTTPSRHWLGERDRERETKNCADRRNMYAVGRIAGRQDEHWGLECGAARILQLRLFSFCLHHQGIYIINTTCMRCMDSGINLTPKFSGRFFFKAYYFRIIMALCRCCNVWKKKFVQAMDGSMGHVNPKP